VKNLTFYGKICKMGKVGAADNQYFKDVGFGRLN